MIIGIAGKAQAGKDTTAMMLQTLITNPNITWDMYNSDIYYAWGHFIVHYADLLKEVSQEMLNMPFDNFNSQEVKQQYLDWLGMTVREFLQKLGTAVRKEIDPDFWVKALFNTYHDGNIIIADVRFPNEAEAIKERGGILIRIERPGAGAGNHISETALDNYTGWDIVIDNVGTMEDLFNVVKFHVHNSL